MGGLEVCIDGCCGAGAGSGLAQALLLPQASILFSAPNAEAEVEV